MLYSYAFNKCDDLGGKNVGRPGLQFCHQVGAAAHGFVKMVQFTPAGLSRIGIMYC